MITIRMRLGAFGTEEHSTFDVLQVDLTPGLCGAPPPFWGSLPAPAQPPGEDGPSARPTVHTPNELLMAPSMMIKTCHRVSRDWRGTGGGLEVLCPGRT